MGFSVDDLVSVLRVFIDRGVRFVVIGDTSVQLALKKRVLEGDVDLFVIEPSVLVDEEVFREIAFENGWEYGSTEIGTPRIIARTGSGDIVLELYENFMDIVVPEKILENSKSISISNVKIKVLYPEQYFVLKARQGVDLHKLEKYLRELKRIDHRLLRESLEEFPRDEQELIIERLKSIGLRI